MNRTIRAALLLATLATLPLSAAIADTPTKDGVVAIVKQAVAFYKANGRQKALVEFNSKDGRFAKGEAYVDVHDLNGMCVAHPTVPDNVGKNVLDQKDVNGKYWIKDIIAETKAGTTSGWTRYVRKNPTNGKLQDKLAYWELYDGLIFKAGLYIQ